MDREDRDHFKTMSLAPAARRRDSQRPPSAASSTSDRAPAAYCLKRAEIMLACYRKDEVHNPETYAAALAAVLGEYDRSIVDYVTDPRTGIPSFQRFLPNVAEVREALDNRASAIERDRSYDARVAEQLRLREEWLSQNPDPSLLDKGQAWLDRSDPAAQELSKERPKVLTEEDKEALIQSAKAAAAQINSGSVKLSEQAQHSIQERDKLRKHLTDDLRND